MSWFDQLQQASFRGVPFGVEAGESSFGRRLAIHEYPKRDKPWVEDMGRKTRPFGVSGFLLENDIVYGGGAVIGQREALIAACEAEGPGTLVHPTYGSLTVSLLEVSISEGREGGYFALSFSFIESGDREFPGGNADTGAATDAAADGLDEASGNDFLAVVSDTLASGASVVRYLASTVGSWTDVVRNLSDDATGLISMVATLPGDAFGRFFGGRRKGFDAALDFAATIPSIADLIDAGATARGAVAACLDTLNEAAANGVPADVAGGARSSIAALIAAMPDPYDAVRLTSSITGYQPSGVVGTSLVAAAEQKTVTACGTLFRRAALAGLARSTAQYQPWSADDAAQLRDNVCALFDAEILVAGDTLDDGSFGALRDLRTAVVQDLSLRGAALPPLKAFTLGGPLPSLALAQRLYRDASRADELVTEVSPRHPAFMPPQFQALAA